MTEQELPSEPETGPATAWWRKIPGFRSGHVAAQVTFIIWTAFAALIVVTALAQGDFSGALIVLVVLYVIPMLVAWFIARARERSAPSRQARQHQKEAEKEQKALQRSAAENQRREAEEAQRKAKAAEQERQRQDRIREQEQLRQHRLREQEEEKARQEAAAREAALTVRLNPLEGRIFTAFQLGQRLQSGESLPTVDPGGMVLKEGESLFLNTGSDVFEFTGREVEYTQGGALFFGNPLFLVGSLAVSAAASAASKAHAKRQAMAQWRHIDSGSLLLTNQRLCVRGTAAWHEIPFTDIRVAECEIDALALHVVNRAPLRIVVEKPEETFLILQKAAWDRSPVTQLPADLAEKVNGAKKILIEKATGRAGS